AQAPALQARELTVVPGGTFGPYIGRSSTGSVLVWAARDAQGSGHWHSLAVDGAGNPKGQALKLAGAPAALSLVVVRRARHDPAAGFVVAAGEPNADEPAVHAFL